MSVSVDTDMDRDTWTWTSLSAIVGGELQQHESQGLPGWLCLHYVTVYSLSILFFYTYSTFCPIQRFFHSMFFHSMFLTIRPFAPSRRFFQSTFCPSQLPISISFFPGSEQSGMPIQLVSSAYLRFVCVLRK